MKKILTPKQLLQIDVIKSMIDFFGGKFSSKIKTKNNLNKFFENVDEKIFFRGKNYYENDYVDYLKYYENENLWEAVVSGTEDYYVSIEFDDSEIKSWKCNCHYDGGPVCKHVIAVLFEIYFKLSEKNFSSSSNQSRKKQIEEIVERLSRKEWADFIEKNLSSESIDKLLDKYSILSGINSESKYYQIITKHLNNIINNSYLPEKECIEKEMRAINDLLLKAERLINRYDFREAAEICRITIEEISRKIGSLDETNPNIYNANNKSFELLERIGKETGSNNLRKKLFNYYFDASKKWYYDEKLQIKIIALLSHFIVDSNDRKKYLNWLTELIDDIKKDEYSEYRYENEVVQLIKLKAEFLRNGGKEKLSEKLLRENIRFNEIRKIFVEREIENKNYDLAVSLVNEGIRVDNSYFEDIDWNEELLRIAELRDDKAKIFKLSRDLFFFENEFDYFLKMKKSCPEKKWEKEVKKLLEELEEENEHGELFDQDVLAQIYVEEKLWGKLLFFLKENSMYLFLVDKYSDYLTGKFPEEMLEIFRAGIISLYEDNGDRVADEIEKRLQKMEKIPGSEEIIQEIKAYLENKQKEKADNGSITFKITDEMIEDALNTKGN